MFRNKPLAQPHRVRRLAYGLTALSLACTGCKAFSGGSTDRPASGSRGDPILGMRLPPQGVPGPDKGDLAGTKRDPLLTSPAGRAPNNPNGQANKSATGEVSALPPRLGIPDDTRVPFRPGIESSPAALAAGVKADDTLTINRRPIAASIGGSTDAKSDEVYAKATRQLRDYNATWTTPVKTDAGYSVAVQRSQSAKNDGPVRKYQGVGTTPTAALQSAAEQIRNDLR